MRGNLILTLVATLLSGGLSLHTAFSQTVHKDPAHASDQEPMAIQRSGHKADSLQSLLKDRSDSLQISSHAKLDEIDSLRKHYLDNNLATRTADKIDSIQNSFNHRSDSLKDAFKNKFSKLEAARSRLQKKLDSLTTLKLPANGITAKLDSLDDLRKKTISDFEKKLEAFKDKATSKLKSLDLPPKATDKLNVVTKNIEGVNIANFDLSGLDVLDNPLDKVGNIDNFNNLPNINTDNPLQTSGVTEKAGDLKVPTTDVKQITGVTEKVSEVTNVTEQVSEYSEEAKQMVKGNVDKAKNLPKTAEDKLAQVSRIQETEQQAKALEKYKAMTQKAKDPEAAKKEAMEKAKQVAIEHFADKQQELDGAMEKMSKYKKKYSSLNSITELSKKPRNEMRGKPWVERVVPGLAIQVQKKGDDLLVDFNAYIGYRFTGRLRAGLGWNQRLGYNIEQYHFNPLVRIYGPRSFGEFKLGKGFSPRVEVEMMNTEIPPLASILNDPASREWVCGVFAGMKKEYKLFKNVKGTAMAMARLTSDHNSPYPDVLNVRFGFEIPYKKKIKASD